MCKTAQFLLLVALSVLFNACQGGTNKKSANCLRRNNSLESFCIPRIAFVGITCNAVDAELEHVCVVFLKSAHVLQAYVTV